MGYKLPLCLVLASWDGWVQFKTELLGTLSEKLSDLVLVEEGTVVRVLGVSGKLLFDVPIC